MSRPKIYIAGTVTNQSWRQALVDDMRAEDTSPIQMADYDYVGPFYDTCRHGCVKPRQGSHGQVAQGICCFAPPKYRHEVKSRCLEGVRSCDIFIAYINSMTSYGTLVELGWAEMLKKDIRVLVDAAMLSADWDELWFAHLGHRFDKVVYESQLPSIISLIALQYSSNIDNADRRN